MQNSGQAGAAPKLRIRGTSTYLGSREPLWVVDGIIRTNPIPIPADRINDPDFVNLLGNAISGLNPYDIEQIDVLKDATRSSAVRCKGRQWRDRDHYQERKGWPASDKLQCND